MNDKVTVLGAGLAGCEAALWLAGKGVQVDLYEQKPVHFSPAHKSAGFAELICSNSLKAERLDSASGLLKEEMRRMGSQLLNAAETARVAAGGALAVDRDAFSAEVTRMVESCENITVHLEQVELFGVGMGFHREDFARDHVPQVLALVEDVLHLGGGEGEAVDEGFQVQAGQVHKIPDPVHRDIHSGFPPSLFVLKLAQGLQVAAVQIADILDAVLHHGQAGKAQAKGKARVLLRVDAAHLQHVRRIVAEQQ